MIRIGVLTSPADNLTSGSGQHLYHILKSILQIDFDSDYEFFFIHYKQGDPLLYKNPAIKEIIIPRNPVLASIKLKKLNLHILHYSPLTVFSPIYCNSRVKKVATIHGGAPDYVPGLMNWKNVIHQKLITPLLIRRMNGILTVSNFSMGFIRSRFSYKGMIRVISNGVTPINTMPKKSESLRLETFLQDDNFALHISNFSYRKNPELLKSIIVELASSKVKFVVAGKGWNEYFDSLGSSIEKARNGLLVFDFVSEEFKWELLRQASVFVFPSFYEGFGMPSIEALSVGTPCVVSDIPASREILGNGGKLISLDSSLSFWAKEVLANAARKNTDKSLLELKQNINQRYNWRESAIKTLEMYHNLYYDKSSN